MADQHSIADARRDLPMPVRKAERGQTVELTRRGERRAVLPLDTPVDRHYGAIRNELEDSGNPISNNELLIAAHARALGATLVTNNVREFHRVPGLAAENWHVAD